MRGRSNGDRGRERLRLQVLHPVNVRENLVTMTMPSTTQRIDNHGGWFCRQLLHCNRTKDIDYATIHNWVYNSVQHSVGNHCRAQYRQSKAESILRTMHRTHNDNSHNCSAFFAHLSPMKQSANSLYCVASRLLQQFWSGVNEGRRQWSKELIIACIASQ